MVDVLSRARLAPVVAGVLALSACATTEKARGGEPLRVAAAADLTFAFDAIAKDFTAKTGRPVTVSYGASGLLAKQISNGAPFDVFASASPSFAGDVVRDKRCRNDSKRVYAYGHLVIVTRKGLPVVRQLEELKSDTWKRIAIANPDHAPYGKAAKEALVHEGLFDLVAARLVFGENVQQALSYVETGNADVAIVAASLASHSGTDGRVAEVAGDLHGTIAQTIVVCTGARTTEDPDSARFADYVLSPEGQRTLAAHSFGAVPQAEGPKASAEPSFAAAPR